MERSTKTKRRATIKRSLTILVMILFSLFGLLCDSALSHPHVFVVQRIEIVFDDKGLAGFKILWRFDEMFSSMIVGDYDKNQNRSLEPDEIKAIKKGAFSYLSNYHYFTFVKIDGQPFEVKFVTDFWAEVKENKLIYRFFVPCHVAARSSHRHIVAANYDPSYYTAIFYAEDRPAALKNAGAFDVGTAIRQDASTSIYYGMVNPWALFLDFRKKQ
jgi:ABC-type uncharacterized transport system substrate-binding protein